MRLLPLLALLVIAGCSHPAPVSPQSPPEPVVGQFETASQINAEISRRYPPETHQPTMAEMTQLAIEILDNAKAEKTVWAVKSWVLDNKAIAEGLAPVFNRSSAERTKAIDNSGKWLIAATDSKKASLLGTSVSVDYETAKKNALSEAARADSLPIN